jgi:hypothetical protein
MSMYTIRSSGDLRDKLCCGEDGYWVYVQLARTTGVSLPADLSGRIPRLADPLDNTASVRAEIQRANTLGDENALAILCGLLDTMWYRVKDSSYNELKKAVWECIIAID